MKMQHRRLTGKRQAGEEPYTLAILWKQHLAAQCPTLEMRIVATDVDPQAIQRAKRGCYPASSLKDLPAECRAQAFVPSDQGFCLKPEYQELVTFFVQDVRETVPDGLFQLRRQLMDLDTLIVAYLSVAAVMGTANVQTLLWPTESATSLRGRRLPSL